MTNDNRRVRLASDVMTHNVTWADAISGYTACGLDFKWLVSDQIVARVTEVECDCMTCLVGVGVARNFVYIESVGTSVVNTAAIHKLEFSDKE